MIKKLKRKSLFIVLIKRIMLETNSDVFTDDINKDIHKGI